MAAHNLYDEFVYLNGQFEKIGGGDTPIDDALSTTSENPVQNKVITNALNQKATINDSVVSNNSTYSSSKINTLINIIVGDLADVIDSINGEVI